jgi:hypothetical protein
MEHTVAVRFTMSVETFEIGEDTGTPVCTKCDVPFRFTGKIESVTIDLEPQTPAVAEAHHRAALDGARIAADRE